MRFGKRYLLPAIVLGSIAASPTIASATIPSITAYNEPGIYGFHAWMPSLATVEPGGAVKFENPYPTTYHGLQFTGGPATPSCTGIPKAAGEPIGAFLWKGECTFSSPGSYTFLCTVHPTEMKGTITVPGTPAALTKPATDVTQTRATLEGTFKPEDNATEYRFDYGTTTVSEHTTSALSAGSADFADHAVSAALTGLSSGTIYRVQLLAIYGPSKTAVLGGEEMFTTPAAAAPTVATGQATGLKETEATLNGTIDPDGEATEYFFEYGTGPGAGQKTEPQSVPVDSIDRPVSATLTGLVPGREYHYRLVASNPSGGPVEGEDHTFTTLPPATTTTTTTTTPTPPPPTITPVLTALPPKAEEPPVFGPPLAGGPSLRSSQHGSSVHGSIDVSRAGAGGRLEVDLLTSGASLARVHRPSSVRVGRYARSSVRSGVVSFVVGLTARGRSALRRRHRLALTVRIVLTPVSGAPETVTRSVVLRG
jgi:plastocyanin